MKVVSTLMVAVTFSLASFSWAAPAPTTPDATQVKAVQDMLAALQAEKMMRATASASRYTSEAQRQSVMDKLGKVPPAQIYQRLATPVAKVVSTGTALELTRLYTSTYGQKLLKQKYNSGPSMFPAQDPQATPAEKKELKRPQTIAARKALVAAEPAIEHEAFVLLSEIIKK